jgi:Protein of unknown function (DUF3667)
MCPESAHAAPIAPTHACRNCGAIVTSEYCAECGQETAVKLPTARVFLREATGRYVSLDGRLWRTLAGLLFRPGFLTREYFAGRRRRYIRPARLFLVLSLALFAAIRFFASVPVLVDDDLVVKPDAKAGAKPAVKPAVKFDAGETGGDLFSVPGFTIHVDRDLNLDIPGANAPWSQELKRRFEHFNRLNRQEKSEQVFLGVVRYGPYAMFVLMPAFALLQMVAYLGRVRRYPDRPNRYAEHLVFAAHMHAFLFLVCVLALAIPFTPLRAALGIWCMLYGFWATKVVYRGRWIGLFARSFVVGIAYLVLFALVIIGLLLVAVLVR